MPKNKHITAHFSLSRINVPLSDI